jgi:hypothetical protein
LEHVSKVSTKIGETYRPKVVINEQDEVESIAQSSKSKKADLLEMKFESKVPTNP